MIKQNDTYTHEISFSQEQVDQFAKISGDCNPIHIDAEYAAKTPFGRPIVHGFFSAAVFSKVFGTLWPGEGTIYISQTLKFLGPVFVDQPYVAKFKAVEVNEEKHRGLIQCQLVDADGKVLIEGEAQLKNTNQF